MTAYAIIASARPELARLAVRSLRTFAPEVRILLRWTAGQRAEEHAETIEAVRQERAYGDAEQIILFDDDACVLSRQWLPTLQRYHAEDYDVVGGMRSRGLVNQVCVDGQIVPHAHCLSFTRDAFEHAVTFRARHEPGLGYLRYDTGVLACLRWRCKVLPFTHAGQYYQGRGGIAEYIDEWGSTLWAHLGRGTSFAPRGPLREMIRRMAARCGARRAQKILRYQTLRAAYLTRTAELLRAPAQQGEQADRDE